MKKLILILIVISLAGCGSGYRITYNTEPTGASIICDGTNEGYSPVTLSYSPSENSKKYGSMKTAPCSAIWSSGARKNYSNTWDLDKFPDGVVQTLTREINAGYSQDAEFALKIKQMNKTEAASNGGGQNWQRATTTTCYDTSIGLRCHTF